MCGFTGFFSSSDLLSNEKLSAIVRPMAQEILSRGPDAYGEWVDAGSGIALAHRRLSVVDLTASGNQPMLSPCERYVLVFNGEIYNHLEIRDGLRHPDWHGHSDTETLLSAFKAWGVERTLAQVDGMFAFGLWDRKHRVLTLGRDRMGEKPVYYGWQGQGSQAVFLFGSDISALRRHPAFRPEINRSSVAAYMRNGYIGSDNSIYHGIKKLLPGSLLRLHKGQLDPLVSQWWSSANLIRCQRKQPFQGSPEQSVDKLEALLMHSVGQQMVADVPLGAFLSGGVDSSTIVALMQAQSTTPVRTFSIGFSELGYNEAQYASSVAKHLGTHHTELILTPHDALDVIPKLPKIYAESFADASQIPTYLVSQLAKQQVTVSLSGDAGDELFCGYNRYQVAKNIWPKLEKMPKSLKSIVSSVILAFPSAYLDKLGNLLPVDRFADQIHKGAQLLNHKTFIDLYCGLTSQWQLSEPVVLNSYSSDEGLVNILEAFNDLNEVELMMAWDTLGYLPDDILTKVDRAAMSVGLETRMPMLGRHVVEFAWSLPIDYKFRGGVTKWPLREVLYRYVPKALIERPKMGFGVPLGEWLRGPLRPWAEDLLSESRLRSEGFLNPIPIRRRWQEHLSGKRNWQNQLWNVLMFQSWLEEHNS